MNDTIEMSSRAVDLLKSIEALRLEPYDDQTGKGISSWVRGATIGYGHLIRRGEWGTYKEGISEAQATGLVHAGPRTVCEHGERKSNG